MNDKVNARLVLMPAPLDFGCDEQIDLRLALPERTLKRAAGLKNWICENAKSTRAYLKRIDAIVPLAFPIQSLKMTELPRLVHKHGDHSGEFDATPLLSDVLDGQDVGLVSEAGMPAVADPGASVVRAAHALGIRVEPLVGPVSLLLALSASGLNGQSFAFVGYLPSESAARSQRLVQLESLARQTGQTQLFIETPYRNLVTFRSALTCLKASTRLSVSSGLTLSTASSLTYAVKDWKNQPVPVSNRTPAVFALGP